MQLTRHHDSVVTAPAPHEDEVNFEVQRHFCPFHPIELTESLAILG